jgi:GNAT superfamily N-acetyltransferase
MRTIKLAAIDAEIDACYSVMVQLRTDLTATGFAERVRRQMESGYHLAYLTENDIVHTVAGFHFGESLSWNRYLYVDDLITDAAQRSRGCGKAMLEWLTGYARDNGCEQLHLDSGLHRADAHRFYQREDMPAVAYHFAKQV